MGILKNLFKKQESSCCNVKIEEANDKKVENQSKAEPKTDSCCSK